MKNKYFIYTLSHPITKEIRYIGVTTTSLEERKRLHICTAKYNREYKYHNVQWIRSLLKNNLEPSIELIDECDLNNWIDTERYWIAQLKAWNFNLTNTATGGIGAGTMSVETRKKISEANKGQIPWNKGVPCKLETKDKLSKTLTGRTTSYETRKKLSLKHNGRKLSDETKNKMSQWQIGRKPSKLCVSNRIIKLSKPITQYSKNNIKIKEWDSIIIASTNTGINKSHISECCTNKRKSAGGFIWKFKN